MTTGELLERYIDLVRRWTLGREAVQEARAARSERRLQRRAVFAARVDALIPAPSAVQAFNVSQENIRVLTTMVDEEAAATGRTFSQEERDQTVYSCLLELPILERRLVGANVNLFGEVDRQRAEATFRFAIWPPLGVIPVAFAAQSGASPGIMYIAIAAAVVVIAVLTTQGSQSERQANDTPIGIARAGIVKFPALERLDAGVS
jgi:hypothetical protein